MTEWHRTRRGGSGAGFTLLEILIALAILSAALTILLGTMANSNQQAIYANRLTQVSQAARSKMLDIEYEVREDGFTENTWRDNGDFDQVSNASWEVEVQPVEIPEETKDELLGKANAQLFGGTDSQGALKGNAAFSAKLPKLIGCIPQMINRIGKKIRRVVLIVKFDFQGREQEIRLTQYIIDKSDNKFGLFGTGDEESGGDLGTSSGSEN